MPGFVHDSARCALNEMLEEAERLHLNHETPSMDADLETAFGKIFLSATQAYRETLVGCILARMQDNSVDVRLPYVGLGENAFNGRDIDERVVNPFLHEKRIPSSRGPYLSVFRRSVRFDESTRSGVRDKTGYDAFLELLSAVERAGTRDQFFGLLKYLMFQFVELRESSVVPLSRIRRISLEQCDTLILGLLSIPSGGRFPVMLIGSAFVALNECLDLKWSIECQGINESDAASGAGGDITIKKTDNSILLAAEITERTVDRSRVVATFNTKIAPGGIEDYLFFVPQPNQQPEAMQQARQYFSQGHEVNFVEIKNWIVMTLATLGSEGRTAFCQNMLFKLDANNIPKALKVAWNEQVDALTSSSGA